VTTTSSTGGWTLSADDENRMMISLAVTVIGFLGTLIFGALGALKRYVVEF
jgi:hypothetical protein